MNNSNDKIFNGAFFDADFPIDNRFSFKNVEFNSREKKISWLLLLVGISPNLNGYRYIRYAVSLTMQNANLIQKVTTGLYPAVAEKFDTTASRVERAIRNAIETSVYSGKMVNLNSIFGFKIFEKNQKPTCSEFIALLADRMLLDED